VENLWTLLIHSNAIIRAQKMQRRARWVSFPPEAAQPLQRCRKKFRHRQLATHSMRQEILR
jgi:hypothetical protein